MNWKYLLELFQPPKQVSPPEPEPEPDPNAPLVIELTKRPPIEILPTEWPVISEFKHVFMRDEHENYHQDVTVVVRQNTQDKRVLVYGEYWPGNNVRSFDGNERPSNWSGGYLDTPDKLHLRIQLVCICMGPHNHFIERQIFAGLPPEKV